MGDFETIAKDIERQTWSNFLTAAAVYSTVELIEGEIVSFYTSFPENNPSAEEGRIVVVTATSIVETKIRLPKGWENYRPGNDLNGIDIESRRIPLDSIIGVIVKSTPLSWEADQEKRSFRFVEISVKLRTGEEIVVVYPSRYVTDHPTQNFTETLKVLGSKCD